ncbi:hypothetical protein M0638_21710 [Roseomonas sp. NAR14]|uniref:Uncharacterized protein n=1 Tax=Roseomonas acroporae TaxID=2937791 RepID=A0A9X1YA76_9PROT|nr:hypothetical protein [Roseomonas acroporae]MCK8786994.1 hypothetical protein [Roseomonas acroporae]
MFRMLTLASALALGTVGAAMAQDAGPIMTGGGDNLQIVYPQPSRNVVGGAYASIQGGGDNTQYSAAVEGRRTERPLGVATMIGGGDNMQIVYAPAPSNAALASAGTRGSRN